MEILKDEVVFSSGNRCYANKGIIGLDPKDLTICEGYDGIFDGGWEAKGLPPEDIFELAEYMVERWQEVADSAFAETDEALRLVDEHSRLSEEERKARAFFSGE